MNFSKKYDYIIESIEKNLTEKPSEIIDGIARELGTSQRALGEGFRFVTNVGLVEYIRIRRVMQALKYKMKNDCSLEEAAEAYLFADQPSLSRACKEVLGTSPSGVTEEALARFPIYTIEEVLKGDNEGRDIWKNVKNIETRNAFGLTRKQYETAEELFKMNDMYEFNEKQLENVYKLKTEHGLTLVDAFDFIEDLYFDEWEIDGYKYSLNEMVLLCWKMKMSSWEAHRVIYNLRLEGIEDVSELPEDVLKLYISDERDYYDLTCDDCKLIIAMMKRGNIPYSEVVEFIQTAIVLEGNVLWASVFHNQIKEITDCLELDKEPPKEVLDILNYSICIESLKKEYEKIQEWKKTREE